ncbi:TonB-dependent receptor [Caulobacter sp. KR2-114]|uniref:TonB-dependent receptor n=1 Tax=Caulobacter sp. KR2-114 TaxID=3400912 RepID=UPI003C0CBF22
MGARAATVAAAGLIASAMALAATPARAAGGLDLPAQDLASALRQLAARAHVDLLFDASRMTGRRSAPVRGAADARAALRQMLAGTGFAVRSGDFGALLIVPGTPAAAAPSAADAEPSAVAELLVVGSRSLNTAIRRSEDDIQPYKVVSSETLATAQSQTLEDYLRTREPSDAQAGTLAQAPVANAGAARSRIDLGGLGPAQTLVLVDGRRLPSIPGQDIFQQADLNGVPLAAIDRVETLTSTAGGIYGPGATGGVINVVLRRDYDGGQIGLSGGETTLGDAPHWRVDGVWGHALFEGRTQVMVAFSHAEDSGLVQGQRGFGLAARQQLIAKGYFGGIPPVSSSLNVIGDSPLPGAPDPEASEFSHKPLNQPLAAGGLASLIANAGSLDDSLSPDGQGTMQSLLSRTRISSVVFSLRQQLSPRIDTFLDVLYLRTQGWAVGPRTQPTNAVLTMLDPSNPYPEGAWVSFPTPGLAATSSDDVRTLRATLGAIVRLGRGWSGELDLTYGRASDRISTPALPGIQGDPEQIDLFDTGAGIPSLWPGFADNNVERQVNALVDVNLRLSGPALSLPAGAATVTLLGEFRREHQPNAFATFTNFDTGAVDFYSIGPQTQTVGSAYAELRAPVLRADSALPLRGLELQLAGRVDGETTTAPADAYFFSPDRVLSGTPFAGRARTFAFTAGVRATPVEGLLLRASVATGYLPPTTSQLVQGVARLPAGEGGIGLDPRRGDSQVGEATDVTFQWHGSPSLRPEHARTLSAGIVVTPTWAPGLRVSLDYTRIDKSREITDFASVDFQFFLDHEAQFPGRVIRAPLSAADIAAGYTVGPVIDIDTTPLNIGRSIVQTIDLDASYRRDTRFGSFRLYLRATWQPDFRRKDDPDRGFYQTAGHIDGPLTLRGNGGVAWSAGRWRADLNVQAYGRYSVTSLNPSSAVARQSYLNAYLQGGATVPAQAYVDLEVSYEQPVRQAPAGLKSVEYRIGIHNLFDTSPSLLVIDNSAIQPLQTLSYNPYGDPRGRRFEMSVVGRF